MSVVLLCAALLVNACATVDTEDIEVVTRISPEAGFADYRTYAWLETARIVNDPLGQWEPAGFDADALVRDLVDRELGRRGLVITGSHPDLLVTFVAGIEMVAPEWRVDPDSRREILQNIPKGALAVLLVDGTSRLPVWVGVAGAEVQRRPENDAVRRRLEYAVTEMFKQFPEQ